MLGTTLLNRYRLDAELGHGGMGTVYRAHDTVLDRSVAVKVVSNTALGTEGRARLLREARAAAQLNHPNIMTVHDVGEDHNVPFIVMELIEGQALRDYTPASIAETLALVKQICAALEHAHGHGIIHRDLKAENVMLTPRQTVKLMDFGLAFSSGVSRLTQEDMLVGTVAYLAPELIEGQPASAASDLYALGVLLYELLAGRLPFEGDNLAALLSQHLHAAPAPASTYNAALPAPIDLLILRLLAKQPDQRPASAREVAAVLEQIGGSDRVPPPVGTALRTNVPVALTSFIGRQCEIEEVKRLLGEQRLVTLVGPGGTGKTRLALQIAGEVLETFSAGVWLVELAPLADPALLARTMASTFELREEGGRPILALLMDYLRPRKTLLILDNCEHLIEACARLAAALLQACPQLHILATSRESLGIGGEVAFRVPSLATPDIRQQLPPVALAHFDAVRLFCDRAAAALPGFTLTEGNAASIAHICVRLDGIPLAIELAAARVKLLRVEQITARLDDRFRLLTGGSRSALDRHQTLQALIDWSYDLLSSPERVLLRRLSVFAGSWTLDAVEMVCVGEGLAASEVLDLLTRLVDKSLVIAEREPEQEARYHFLETIRQYAREKLRESGESALMRDRHLTYLGQRTAEIEPHLRAAEQLAWLAQLDREHDNLRAALEWSLERNVEAGLQLGTQVYWWWLVRGLWSEGREWLTALLAHPDSTVQPISRAKALNAAGHLAWFQEDNTSAAALYQESLALYQTFELEERRVKADILFGLGRVARRQGDPVRAGVYYEESLTLWRELQDNTQIAYTLLHLGTAIFYKGEVSRARSLLEEGLTLARKVGDRTSIAPALNMLGEVYEAQGDLVKAQQRYAESLTIFRSMRDPFGMAYTLDNQGWLALRRGELQQASAFFRESLAFCNQIGFKGGSRVSLSGLVAVAVELHQPERAAQLMGAMQPETEEDFEQLTVPLETTRAQLDPTAFQIAWEKGQTMTWEEMIAFALEA